MLLLKDAVNCELLPSFCSVCDDFEILTARAGKYLFVCYRPPNGNLPSFFCIYEQFLRFVSENNLFLILGGDFNIDLSVNSACEKAMITIIE